MGQTGRRSLATHILAVKIALGRLHFHGFGVARQGSWVTSVNKALARPKRQTFTAQKPESLSRDSGLLPAPLEVALSKRVYSPHRGSVLQGVIVPSGSCACARV